MVDMGGTLSRLVVYLQGGQKCVLTLLAVLHQPVCNMCVCNCMCLEVHTEKTSWLFLPQSGNPAGFNPEWVMRGFFWY